MQCNVFGNNQMIYVLSSNADPSLSCSHHFRTIFERNFIQNCLFSSHFRIRNNMKPIMIWREKKSHGAELCFSGTVLSDFSRQITRALQYFSRQMTIHRYSVSARQNRLISNLSTSGGISPKLSTSMNRITISWWKWYHFHSPFHSHRKMAFYKVKGQISASF